MSKMKWFMKQYWRIGQTRALLSLAMGMLSLGRVYVGGVPVLSGWGFWGAATLGILLVFVFLGVGWAYDVKGRFWSAQEQSKAERDVYKYLPNIKTHTIDYPAVYALLKGLKATFVSMGLSSEQIDEIAAYMLRYFNRAPERKDILEAEHEAMRYNELHPFQSEPTESKEIALTSRAKLAFTTSLLRLNWAQELTGMIQDSLVFAAVYVVFIFPDAVVGESVPLFYLGVGFIILSIPMLFAQTSLGWYYDKKLRVWSPSNIVTVERSPYTYVAFPRQYVMDFPFYYAFLETLRDVYIALDMDPAKIESLLEYMDRFGGFRASRERDFQKALELREEFGQLFDSKQEERDAK